MLILSRRKGEVIRVGDEITITILSIDGARARVGICAPRDVTVDREEIYERKQRDRNAHLQI